MAEQLVEAVKNNYLPVLEIMCKYGLDGYGGIDPLDVFKCYKIAIVDGGVTAEDINASNNISELILKNRYVIQTDESKNIRLQGGFKYSIEQNWQECPICNSCSIHACGCDDRIIPRLCSRSFSC